MMSKNAAITYSSDGIRVNSIHPGFIDTPLTQAQDPAINANVIGLMPMKREGTPLEIANGCRFLASDESSFMTGAELVIDGGVPIAARRDLPFVFLMTEALGLRPVYGLFVKTLG